MPALPRFTCVTIVALLPLIVFAACSAKRAPPEQDRGLIPQPIGRPFEPGDILVVRGVFSNCPDWKGRPIGMAEIPSDGGVELLSAVQVNALGRWPADVRNDLVTAYLAIVPQKPTPRLTVEVADSIDSQRIGKEVADSLASHLNWGVKLLRTRVDSFDIRHLVGS
jgi:hypothetical protein